jgi:outer membrane lipoprotein-sorting protein
MHRPNVFSFLIALGLLTVPAALLIADEASDKGLAIAQEADHRTQGFGDYTASLRMVLRLKADQESTREMRMKVLEQENDGDKTLVVFDEPKDVQGTALLTFSHRTGDDDQWLYLPALERVKRISSSNQSGPFMGSEFAYEDLASQEVEKYTYRYLREEELDGESCFVVERVPTHPKSGYTRQVVWFDQAEYRILRVDFYDRKEALLKTLTQSDYQRFLDRFWQPGKMVMKNHQNNKVTELHWSEYNFQTGLEERDFDRASLARIR